MVYKIMLGTDGWRGVIAEDYTFDNVRRCAQGFANYLLEQGRQGQWVVVGHDKRFQSEHLARSILETFRAYAHTPYVVAANKQDLESAWEADDMRIALRLDSRVKLIRCIAADKESVKTVLLELLYSILAEMEELQS